VQSPYLLHVPHAADEGAVNLQGVEGKAVQVTQRRIARTEIIDSQANSQGFNLLQHSTAAEGSAITVLSVISSFKALEQGRVHAATF